MCTESGWWNYTAGNYSNRPNGVGQYDNYCPVIFGLCECTEALMNGAFNIDTPVGIEMAIMTKAPGGAWVEGDNGVYFGELYSGNVIMSNNETFLCNPTCTTLPVSVTTDTQGIPYYDGSWCYKKPGTSIYYRFTNELGTFPQYFKADGTAGTIAAPSCVPHDSDKSVKISTDYVMNITEVDIDRGLSFWALDIPTIYVTHELDPCTSVGMTIMFKSDLSAVICADCSTECVCLLELYQACGDSLLLDLLTDNYGDETSWEICNSNAQVVASGSGYASNTEYISHICLPDGDYTFTIYDSYGDGICCVNGNGYYTLTNTSTNEGLAQGGEFGVSESTSFSIGNGSPTPKNLIDWNNNLVADFGDNGLWYHNGINWNWMSNTGHVGQMVGWDNKLVVDFGVGKGMYYYDGAWHWMTNNSDPNMMIAWNNGTTEKLVVDWGTGNRIYTYDGSWNWFSNKDGVADMTLWNNKLIVDFGSGRGMYNYDTAWHWMTNKDDVNLMLPWDNGTTERLVVDFGSGRRMYTYDGAWSWFINKDDVNDMTVWNQKLVVDFGGGRCLYNYDTSWHWMNNKDDVARMVTWRDAGTDLAVDFGSGRNMYNYNGAWAWIKNANDVPEMLAWNNRLVVDFGAGMGVYNYNGSWHQMKPWSTAD